MQFGAMNFPVSPVLDEIEIFARMEFDFVEIAMDPPMAHYSVLSADLKAIRNSLETNDLDVVCHLPTFVSTADLTESLRRASVTEMQRSLSVACDLGAVKVVLHPSLVSGMGAFVMETVKGYAFDFLSEIAISAEGLGITICLENMMPRNMFGVEVIDFIEIFSAFPSFMLTLDTGHANLTDPLGSRLAQFVEQFGDRIAHLHFSDNRGHRDEHLAIGKGTVRFQELCKTLKKTGYNDTLTLEIFDSDRRSLLDSRKTIKQMLSV